MEERETHKEGGDDHSADEQQTRAVDAPFALRFGQFLEHADTIIHALVGICFLISAVVVLGYGTWNFGFQILHSLSLHNSQFVAETVIQFLSDLLLVLIIMEVLGTIVHYLRVRTTSLRPFLYIGIISASRNILSIGARLAVGGPSINATGFRNAMIELGVSAIVVLALGITLKLLGRGIDNVSE
jgi:uncharacterized membrane protein (DUF373 family)